MNYNYKINVELEATPEQRKDISMFRNRFKDTSLGHFKIENCSFTKWCIHSENQCFGIANFPPNSYIIKSDGEKNACIKRKFLDKLLPWLDKAVALHRNDTSAFCLLLKSGLYLWISPNQSNYGEILTEWSDEQNKVKR